MIEKIDLEIHAMIIGACGTAMIFAVFATGIAFLLNDWMILTIAVALWAMVVYLVCEGIKDWTL